MSGKVGLEMRIAVVGPTYPIRGGISHYTTLLVRNLRRRNDVLFVSYAKQYPGFLFPGRTQFDSSKEAIVEDNASVLSFANPMTWSAAASLICGFCPEKLVISWVNPALAFQSRYIARRVKAKSPRTRVVFWCHNVRQHEEMPLYLPLTRFAFKSADFFIVTGEEAKDALLRMLPRARVAVESLPSLEEGFARVTRAEARKELGIRDSARVILNFGFVREYKGLIYLIRALPRISEGLGDFVLVVAGEFWEPKEKYFEEIQKTGLSSKVMVFDEYIQNERVPLFFEASDVVVLPYTSASGSGIVQLAYTFCKPVITTEAGALPEAVANGVTGFVVPPRDPEAIAKAVLEFFKRADSEPFEERIKAFRSRFSWEGIVRRIEEI